MNKRHPQVISQDIVFELASGGVRLHHAEDVVAKINELVDAKIEEFRAEMARALFPETER